MEIQLPDYTPALVPAVGPGYDGFFSPPADLRRYRLLLLFFRSTLHRHSPGDPDMIHQDNISPAPRCISLPLIKLNQHCGLCTVQESSTSDILQVLVQLLHPKAIKKTR